MQRRTLPILALLTLGLPLPAQDTTVAQSPALVIRTTHEEMANNVMQTFEAEGELPKLEKNQHWLLTLDASGKAKIQAATGASSTLEIDAQPAALMTIYKDQIEQQQQMASMMGMMMLQQMGLDAGDAAGLIKDVFEFPNQISTLQLRYKGDPENAAAGFDVGIDLQPKSGTKFAAFCTALKPNPQGVALAAREAPLSMAMSVDLPSVTQQLAPLMRAMAALSAGQGDAKAAKDVSERMVKLMDGTISFVIDKGLKAVAGVTDGAALQQLVASPEYVKLQKESGDGQAEYVPEAFAHNGVKVAKTVISNEMFEDNPLPLFQDGKLTLLSAVTGPYLVMATTDNDAKQLIDASAKDLKRAPLPGDALLWMNLKIHELASMFGDGPDEDAPKNVEVQLGKQQSGLGLKVIGK
jgi:hypothetical protein